MILRPTPNGEDLEKMDYKLHHSDCVCDFMRQIRDAMLDAFTLSGAKSMVILKRADTMDKSDYEAIVKRLERRLKKLKKKIMYGSKNANTRRIASELSLLINVVRTRERKKG